MKIRCRTLLLLALLSGKVCSADSVNIGVTGNIVASPCIFNGGSNSLDVNLGQYSGNQYGDAGLNIGSGAFQSAVYPVPNGNAECDRRFHRQPRSRRERTIS